MQSSRAEHEAVRAAARGPAQAAAARAAELEQSVSTLETCLASLSQALHERDALAVESGAQALHQALARAVAALVQAARHGEVSPVMRLRLSDASAQVVRQRESLARATAALDRAVDLLMPGHAAANKVYNAAGLTQPVTRGGSLSA